ncbi:MAG: NHL repeat-containing protein, partial [Candidatus Binatia bacterium]
MAVDAAGNLYVADTFNSRVLEYDSPFASDTEADRVFGQEGRFDTTGCNQFGRSAGSLCRPFGVAVDGAGNVYVADSLNNRVLECDSPLTTDVVADRTFGDVSGPTSASTLRLRENFAVGGGVAVDTAGNLYVADEMNDRVLVYEAPLSTDAAADHVLGQPDFVSGGEPCSGTSSICCQLSPPTAESLCRPHSVAVDASGNVYVADVAYQRVVEYDSPLATDASADRVFGQVDLFAQHGCNRTGVNADGLCNPAGVAVDTAGDLWAADTTNERVLRFDAPLATDTTADRVLGQVLFTMNVSNLMDARG